MIAPAIRGLAAAAVLCAAPTLAQDSLVVGVRTDAPPFSYHLDEGAEGGAALPRELGFDGFMVRLCNGVLDDLRGAGVGVETVVVHAGDRFDRLESGEVHILCDPATIVPDRLRHTVASAPVYMSAVTFAGPEVLSAANECKVIVGLVGRTTATAGTRTIAESGGWPRYGETILGALEAIRNGQTVPTVQASEGECDAPIVEFFDTHVELARDFCAGGILFYVGDVEIVRASIARAGCAGTYPVRPAIYSDERYAIYTALPQDGVPSDAILLFLAELARQMHHGREGTPTTGSVLVDLFDDLNPDRTASEKLATFFWAITGHFPLR